MHFNSTAHSDIPEEETEIVSEVAPLIDHQSFLKIGQLLENDVTLNEEMEDMLGVYLSGSSVEDLKSLQEDESCSSELTYTCNPTSISHPLHEQLQFEDENNTSFFYEREDTVTDPVEPDGTLSRKIRTHNVRYQNELSIFHGPELRIIAFLHKIKAPLYAYDELLKLLSDISETNHTFGPNFITRKRLMGSGGKYV